MAAAAPGNIPSPNERRQKGARIGPACALSSEGKRGVHRWKGGVMRIQIGHFSILKSRQAHQAWCVFMHELKLTCGLQSRFSWKSSAIGRPLFAVQKEKESKCCIA